MSRSEDMRVERDNIVCSIMRAETTFIRALRSLRRELRQLGEFTSEDIQQAEDDLLGLRETITPSFKEVISTLDYQIMCQEEEEDEEEAREYAKQVRSDYYAAQMG